jgi:hypothetical protein
MQMDRPRRRVSLARAGALRWQQQCRCLAPRLCRRSSLIATTPFAPRSAAGRGAQPLQRRWARHAQQASLGRRGRSWRPRSRSLRLAAARRNKHTPPWPLPAAGLPTPPAAPSEFARAAAEIAAAIAKASAKLGRVAALAKRTSAFDDPSREIDELSSLVKHEVRARAERREKLR